MPKPMKRPKKIKRTSATRAAALNGVQPSPSHCEKEGNWNAR